MILILGGTSTTHDIVSSLTTDDYIISVATEYGRKEFEKRYPYKILHTRFTTGSLEKLIKDKGITKVIDTTHPHAQEITRVAKEACLNTRIEYQSMVRCIDTGVSYDRMFCVTDYDSIISRINEKGYKSIMITTGGNNIEKFSSVADISYVRVLPFEKSIKACTDAGFHYSHIIAMQGPFSEQFNIALIKELKTDCLITKNSGEGSGYIEKINACKACGIDVITLQPE